MDRPEPAGTRKEHEGYHAENPRQGRATRAAAAGSEAWLQLRIRRAAVTQRRALLALILATGSPLGHRRIDAARRSSSLRAPISRASTRC